MTNGPTKEDLRRPDEFVAEGRKALEWSTHHVKLLVGTIVITLVVGISISLYQSQKKNTALKAQEELFQVEKTFWKKRQTFAESKVKMAAAEGKEKVPTVTAATGDIEKDFGPEIVGFKKVIEQHKGSPSAAMALVALSSIYVEYSKNDEAKNLIEGSLASIDKTSLLGGVVQQAYGTILANTDHCDTALTVWQGLVESRHLKFMQGEVKIKMALCEEKLGHPDKALILLTSLQGAGGKADAEVAKQADRYLRVLKKKGT